MINKTVNIFISYFSTLNAWQKIFSIILFIFIFTLPYSAKVVTNTLIILLVFIWGFSAMPFKNYSLIINDYKRKIVLSFSVLFLIYLIGFIIPNEIYNKDAILIKLPILVFPLIFITLDKELFDKKFYKILLNVFVFGTFTTLMILSVKAYIDYQITNDIREFFYVKFCNKDHHPTYLAMFVVFALFISFNEMIEQKKLIPIYIILIIVFVFYLILMSSKAGILSYFALLIFGIIYYLPKFKKNFIIIISSVLLLFYGLALYKSLPIAQKRMGKAEEALNLDNTERVNSSDGTSVRILVWEESLKFIIKKPFFGYGTGNERKVLMSSEVLSASEHITEGDVWPDAHNQYLQSLLSVGIFGFLIVTYLILISLRLGLKYKNYLLLILICLSSINWLFESMLDKQGGIIFFSFFLCLIILNLDLKSNTNNLVNSIGD